MSEPGTLRPRAIAVITALFTKRNRTATAWWIARATGEDPLNIVPLMWDMLEIGLVERCPKGVGYRSSWRLLIAGPVLS